MSTDFEHFPGLVNPVTTQDVTFQGESTDGLTMPETAGYPAVDWSQHNIPIENLDQHDLNLDHPGMDTPSGLDHVNPRGQITTDGKLDVPEDTVGYAKLDSAIEDVLQRNRYTVLNRPENPGLGQFRTVTVDATNPIRIATQDDFRASIRLWVVSGSTCWIGPSIGDVQVGVAANAMAAQLTAAAGAVLITTHDDVWLMATTTTSVVSYIVERWDKR